MSSFRFEAANLTLPMTAVADFCLIVLRKAAVPLKLPNLTVPD